MDCSHATSVKRILKGYDEYKKIIITAKSNTVAANQARDECWQKTVDHVNL